MQYRFGCENIFLAGFVENRRLKRIESFKQIMQGTIAGSRRHAEINAEAAVLYRRATIEDRSDTERITRFEYMRSIVGLALQPLTSYIHTGLSITDEEDRQDFAQETLLRFFRADPKPDLTITPVLGWLFLTAHNIQRDILRKAYVRRDRPIFKEPSDFPDGHSKQQNILLVMRLERAFQSITDDVVRQAAHLRFVERYTEKEVAANLGISEKEAKRHIQTARMHFYRHPELREFFQRSK